MAEERQQENQGQQAPKYKTPLEGFIYHQLRAAEFTVKALNALLPPDFHSHSREARKEFSESLDVLFKGFSEAVENELNKFTKATDGSTKKSNAHKASEGPSTTGKTKVRVEVS